MLSSMASRVCGTLCVAPTAHLRYTMVWSCILYAESGSGERLLGATSWKTLLKLLGRLDSDLIPKHSCCCRMFVVVIIVLYLVQNNLQRVNGVKIIATPVV